MSNLGIGLVVAGGFLFGVGIGHIVLFSDILATFGAIMVAIGLLVSFIMMGRKVRR
jgi:hypothetical protein